MIGTVFAVAALTIAADPYRVGVDTGRDALLVDPAPYPAGKVDNPARLENGRLWVSRGHVSSRTPIAEQAHGVPGAAWYGAAPSEDYAIAFIRIGTQAIAIDPFARYDDDGFMRFREARNQWLREQGYVASVRTHVNPRYHAMHDYADAHASAATDARELPEPRATIRLKPAAGEESKKLRAGLDALREGDVVHRPDALAPVGPAISYDEWVALAAPAEPVIADAAAEESGA